MGGCSWSESMLADGSTYMPGQLMHTCNAAHSSRSRKFIRPNLLFLSEPKPSQG